MVVELKIDRTKLARMTAWANAEVAHFARRGGGLYGHNDVDKTLKGCMGEYAVRTLYRQGNIQAHQTLSREINAPDITVPSHTILTSIEPARCEEVKTWDAFHWERFGKTIRPSHAKKYADRGRSRVWFCSADVSTGIVHVHGWATPEEILEAKKIMTQGRYGAENHYLEVLHRVHEVMPWVDDKDDLMEWW